MIINNSLNERKRCGDTRFQLTKILETTLFQANYGG